MNNNHCDIQLEAWIFAGQEDSHNLPAKYGFCHGVDEQQSVLITITNVKPDTLSVLGKFTLETRQEQQILAFLSHPFQINSNRFQVAYLPYKQTKQQNSCANSISDILRVFSAVMITDVSCSGIHKYRDDKLQSGETKQLVIVNGKDVYQLQSNEGKLQLTKKVECSLDNQNIIMPEYSSKSIALNIVGILMEEYIDRYNYLLNSDNNWKTFVDFVIISYKLNRFLESESILAQRKPSLLEIDSLSSQLLQIFMETNPLKSKIQKQIGVKILKRMLRDKHQYVAQTVEQIDGILAREGQQNIEQFQITEEYVNTILQSHTIPQIFAQFILNQREKSILFQENQRLLEKQEILHELVMQRNNELLVKNHKIQELKQMIEQFTVKAEEMKRNTMKMIEISQFYEQEKQKNWQLTLEVDSYIFMGKKNADSKLEMETKMQNLMKEKSDLLLGMQELTEENLGLMNERQYLTSELKDCKEKLVQANLMEARALKSIQNQAEIKVRLNRYENYVHELKLIFASFKKLQIEKFNFILEHNYKEHEQLQQKYKCSQFQLRRAQGKIKQLHENLHCEKIKTGYFEKMFVNSYLNEPIPEVSQESSPTDRTDCEIPQNA